MKIDNSIEITKKAIELIDFEGEVVEVKSFGGGLINATYLVKGKLPNGEEKKYILQRINHNIFKEVEKLMDIYQNVCYNKRVNISLAMMRSENGYL